MPIILALIKLRQVDCYKFEAYLSYMMSSRVALAAV